MDAVVGPPDRVTCQLDPVYAFGQSTQDGLALGPRNVLPDAGVNPHTQSEVSGGLARYVKTIRLIPMGWVAVGGT